MRFPGRVKGRARSNAPIWPRGPYRNQGDRILSSSEVNLLGSFKSGDPGPATGAFSWIPLDATYWQVPACFSHSEERLQCWQNRPRQPPRERLQEGPRRTRRATPLRSSHTSALSRTHESTTPTSAITVLLSTVATSRLRCRQRSTPSSQYTELNPRYQGSYRLVAAKYTCGAITFFELPRSIIALNFDCIGHQPTATWEFPGGYKVVGIWHSAEKFPAPIPAQCLRRGIGTAGRP